jgi:hypothetical protein
MYRYFNVKVYGTLNYHCVQEVKFVEILNKQNVSSFVLIEPNNTYRKYKEFAHMSQIDHPISQPSLDISPVWTSVITAEVRKLHTTSSSVDCVGNFVFLVLVPYGEF